MKECKMLPQSLIVENRVGWRWGILLTAALFLLIFLPWLSSERELFRQEGFFAAAAVELVENISFQDGVPVTVHHVVMDEAFPLYPLTVSLLYRAGVPMENALRIISVIMLGIMSLLAGIAAASRSGARAGLVAACCCFGTLFALDNAPVGGAETMAACFLFAAQLLFFHYGSRLADWNSAWIAAAILVSLGFLAAGPIVIIFFGVPLLFLRRPLSSGEKYRTAGFIAGAVLVAAVVTFWMLPQKMLGHNAGEIVKNSVQLGEYLYDVLLFPLLLPFRLLPWTVIMWMPFCVALQAISPLPVFSLYLRTLIFSMLALAWLLPGAPSAWIFFVIGPLAVLTGVNYELGVRRYGVILRKIITVGALLFPAAGGYMLGLYWLPDKMLAYFTDPEKIVYRHLDGYIWILLGFLGFLAVLAIFSHIGRQKFPVWVNLLLLSAGIAVVGAAILLPRQLEIREWRQFGEDVRRVLPPSADRIYKYDIQGMFNGLFYTGKPVYKLRKDEALPSVKKVYLIAPRFPDLPDRSWRSLLPAGYSRRGTPVSLWEGTPVQPDGEEQELL